MIVLFYILASLLIYLSYRSFRGGINYLNYFRHELAKPQSDFTPFASIIVPCKGVEEGLKANLEALRDQDYPEYEVIFVVDDAADPAADLIKDVIYREDAESRVVVSTPFRGKVVIAPTAVDSSQKVENLREAVLHATGDIFVFVDSDVRPSTDWLRQIAAPLEDEQIGASTGYRWFISPQPTFASEMRSAWNGSIASVLGPDRKSNFCWGGSTAIRRHTFENLNVRERWRGMLSDDFGLTRFIHETGMEIVFVPQALSATVGSCSLSEMLEFTTRQMKVTRVYSSHLWKLSLFGSGLFTIVMMMVFAISILSRTNNGAVMAALATLLLVSGFSIGKSWLRLKAVRLVLREYDDELRRQFLPQCTFWLLAPPLFLYNCLAALFYRRITWRGQRYELVSATETKRIG
jgi:cellulose synthase/poly-beta-1,6-N-acetylglucosamine synthase-like glycosyltransferase